MEVSVLICMWSSNPVLMNLVGNWSYLVKYTLQVNGSLLIQSEERIIFLMWYKWGLVLKNSPCYLDPLPAFLIVYCNLSLAWVMPLSLNPLKDTNKYPQVYSASIVLESCGIVNEVEYNHSLKPLESSLMHLCVLSKYLLNEWLSKRLKSSWGLWTSLETIKKNVGDLESSG